MEYFSEPTHTEIEGTPQARKSHAVFHSFLSDDSKQDSATTTAHRKHIIKLLKQRNIMPNTLSSIWLIQMVVLSTTYMLLHYT